MTNQQQVQVGILRIYLKDLSFESPVAPAIFNEQMNPEIKLNIQVDHDEIEDDIFEVVLTVNVEAKKEQKTYFIVEVEQAGLFRVEGLEGERRQHLLEVFCADVLYPYARQCVDQALLGGSLPPMALSPINFDQLYQKKRQQ